MNTISNNQWPWDVLGIESNADERAVRRAYARLLKQQRPDQDAEAFQRLRYAYESALQMASGAIAKEVAAAPTANASCTEPERLIATTRKSATAPATSHVTVNTSEVEAAVREPDAFETAVQLWQNFIAQTDDLESRRSLQDLFAAVVNIATRDELEWQALCHCLNEDTPAMLRMNLSAVLGWRDNAAHLRRRNAAIAMLALNRVFADEDYNALRLRFTNAMALLEGPSPQLAAGARALLRAGVRAEMEQLLTALGRYHPNVVRLRLDAEKVDFWGRCLKFRIGAGRLFGPALALNAWCGLLFADASLKPNSSRWFDQWSPAQLGILLSTLMLALVTVAATTVLLSEPQQQRLRALRSIGWLRYGWIPVWLGATTVALCEERQRPFDIDRDGHAERLYDLGRVDSRLAAYQGARDTRRIQRDGVGLCGPLDRDGFACVADALCAWCAVRVLHFVFASGMARMDRASAAVVVLGLRAFVVRWIRSVDRIAIAARSACDAVRVGVVYGDVGGRRRAGDDALERSARSDTGVFSRVCEPCVDGAGDL